MSFLGLQNVESVVGYKDTAVHCDYMRVAFADPGHLEGKEIKIV